MRAIELSLAVLGDSLLGEPRFGHPLVFFGSLAHRIEKLLYADPSKSILAQKVRGILAVLMLVGPIVLTVVWVQAQPGFSALTQVLSVYIAIGMKSLSDHAVAVGKELESSDLDGARKQVGKIVSRDTTSLNSVEICKAAIESVLENGNDAVFAPIFWFLILGAPGAVLYRLANTLDAMWGYKNERYLYFGWAAARFDDILNWIPARLTALTYTLIGKSRVAWYCWRSQSPLWYSPNAGPVMAAGAGALELELGGAAIYHGSIKERPKLGSGSLPEPEDISRSVSLVRKGMFLWVIISLSLELINARAWR